MRFSRVTVLCLTLLLCAALAIGGTTAFFTDTVTSEENVITAGNLDIELGRNSTVTINDMFATKRWESGAVALQVYNVQNAGNLSFKYRAGAFWGECNELDGHTLKEALKIAVLTSLPENIDITTAEGRQAVLDAVGSAETE